MRTSKPVILFAAVAVAATGATVVVTHSRHLASSHTASRVVAPRITPTTIEQRVLDAGRPSRDLIARLGLPAPEKTLVPDSTKTGGSSFQDQHPATQFDHGKNLFPEPWQTLAYCESLRDGSWKVSSGSYYRGFFQFDYQTWQSVGGTGDPAAASPAEQLARAQRLQAERGWSPWPVCRHWIGE